MPVWTDLSLRLAPAAYARRRAPLPQPYACRPAAQTDAGGARGYLWRLCSLAANQAEPQPAAPVARRRHRHLSHPRPCASSLRVTTSSSTRPPNWRSGCSDLATGSLTMSSPQPPISSSPCPASPPPLPRQSASLPAFSTRLPTRSLRVDRARCPLSPLRNQALMTTASHQGLIA